MSDRELIFSRIRVATADVVAAESSAWSLDANQDPTAAYIRRREVSRAEMHSEFIEYCRDYRANVTVCEADDKAIGEAVDTICSRRGVTTLAAPRDLPAGWLPGQVIVHADEPELSVADLDACDGVLTGCAAAVASTGTIVLDAGATQGRRVLTLIPDLHICVIRSEQIQAGVPEAIAELRQAVADGAPLTFISGPSATSDIELRRVEGVHGPRQLEVIVAGAER